MQEKIHKGHLYSGLQLGWRMRDTEEREETREGQEYLLSLAKDAAPAHTKAGHRLHTTSDIFPHFPQGARALASVFVAPRSGCRGRAVLYFRPDITQQAGKAGYSLNALRWEQLL